MKTVLSYSYDSLVETLNHIKSLKLKHNTGENVTDCCDVIFVDAEHLESDGAFKTEHLGYIMNIFKYNSDSRFHL